MSYRRGGLVTEALNVAKASLSMPRGIPRRGTDPVGHLFAAKSAPLLRSQPVVLLHGFLQTASSLDTLALSLSEDGFDCYSYNYKTLGAGVERAAEALSAALITVADSHGSAKVYVVAHSMGGLVARAALKDPEVASRVAMVVTLGTPHSGTPLALFASKLVPGLSRVVREFMPGSDILKSLDTPSSCFGVRWVALYSIDDHVVPNRSGRLDVPAYAATNIEFTGVGHAGLLYNSAVLARVSSVLCHADDKNVSKTARSLKRVTTQVVPPLKTA